MALTASVSRRYTASKGNDIRRKIAASSQVFEGGAVSSVIGYVKPLVTGESFRGFAIEEVNNAGANGDRDVLVRPEGEVEITVEGVDGVDDEGKTVHASDDGTFTLTVGSNVPIGKVSRHVEGERCFVFFQAAERQSLDVTP